MAKNLIRASRKVGVKASSLLRNKQSSSKVKSVAGSALVNRKRGTKH